MVLLVIARLLWLACAMTAVTRANFLRDSSLRALSGGDEVATTYLGQDPESGCICRENPNKLVICFGGNVCKLFPKSVNVPTEMLRVKTTNIRSILEGDLQRMRHLRYLEIEANHNLVIVRAGVFRGMTKLEYLSLSFNNKLNSLEVDVFTGLDHLQYLKMVKNAFLTLRTITPSLKPLYLPSLIKLDLSENYLSRIQEEDFKSMNGSKLNELSIVLCQLDYINPKSLIYLRHLSELRIGENILNSRNIADVLNVCILNNIPIKTVNLFGMGFRKSPPLNILKSIANSNVTELILAKNQFEFLMNGSFPKMPELTFLDLRENLAVGIDSNAFGEDNFPKLTTLLLGGNKLGRPPQGALLPQLNSLDLSANAIGDFHTSYFELGECLFANMTRLLTLNLSYNKVNYLSNTTFIGLENLKVLSLKNDTIYHIGPGAFRPLKTLEFLNIENNMFPANENLSKDQFAGLTQLRVLLLGSCMIQSFKSAPDFFTAFPNLTRLSLRNNELAFLPRDLFESLTHLEAVDLSDNKLPTWRDPIFSIYNKNLFKLILSGNKITYFSDEMLRDFQSVLSQASNETELQIRHNPYICNCILFHSVEKYIGNQNATKLDQYFANSLAVCASPDEWADKTIAEYWSTFNSSECSLFSEFVSISKSTKVIVILPFLIILTITICVSLISMRYRWYLRYYLFYNTRKRSTETKHYKYDAFVSYSSEDSDFVTVLVTTLEGSEHGFKLCVYERDFEIGSVITEAVLDSMSQSRHVMLIISDSFAKSQWCRWETQMAEHHRLFSANDPLILIKLGSISTNYLTPTLKHLLKTKVYLEWNQSNDFWTKLKWTLKKHKY